MLPELLPEELLSKIQTAVVNPHYEPPETGNYMPVYDGSTGELLKVGSSHVFNARPKLTRVRTFRWSNGDEHRDTSSGHCVRRVSTLL